MNASVAARGLVSVLACVAAAGGLWGCAVAPERGVEIFAPAGLPKLGPYSPAVAAGDLVFLAGIIPFDAVRGALVEPDIRAQTEQALRNLDAVLKAASLSREDIVKVTVFLRSPADMPGMNAVYADYFADHQPARTTVPGADWGRDDLLIEIDVIARRQR